MKLASDVQSCIHQDVPALSFKDPLCSVPWHDHGLGLKFLKRDIRRKASRAPEGLCKRQA